MIRQRGQNLFLSPFLSHFRLLDEVIFVEYNTLLVDVSLILSRLSLKTWRFQTDYPNFFSLAIRTNPFNPDATAVFTS